jgi:hypothetical protein
MFSELKKKTSLGIEVALLNQPGVFTPMTTLHATEPTTRLQAPKKLTGFFTSRISAKKALKALRKAGYLSHEVRVLHSLPPSTLYRAGLYDVFSKYVRHLVNPKRILIRVTSHDIGTAAMIFRDLGAETAVNHFFHQTSTFSRSPASLPIRRWSE